MKFQKFGNTYMVRMDKGEEVMEQLGILCKAEKITLAQVSALGAADHVVVGVYDLPNKAYHWEELDAFMEIAGLTGSVTMMNDQPYFHLHGTFADTHNVIHGGHVKEIRIGATCEMFLTIVEGEVTREYDPTLGINLWKL